MDGLKATGMRNANHWRHSRLPTVNDMRQKTCWICLQDEPATQPHASRRPWVHPCSCTLVAHESCLLTWIRLQDPDRTEAPKCPQCNTVFQIDSRKPRLLVFLDKAREVISSSARISSGIVLGSTILGISALYGAYATKTFLGPDMAAIVLGGSHPREWRIMSFFNLPLIPYFLLIGRSRVFHTMSMVIPFMLIPDSHAIRALRHQKSPSFPFSLFADFTPSPDEFHTSSIFTFPPSPPLMFGLFPLVRMGYRRLYKAVSKWLLTPAGQRQGHNQPRHDELRDINDQVEAEQDEQIQADDILGALDRGDRVMISGTTLCRMFISSLSMPAISQLGGQALLGLSMKWRPLQAFLGVNIRTSLGKQLVVPKLAVLGVSAGWSYADYDPVWWRNALGLTIFLVGSDMVGLLHKYLRQVEKRSRRIIDRPFDMVDLDDLDLVCDED